MPHDNSRKTHLAVSLTQFAARMAGDSIDVLGKALPCHITAIKGQIVTVAFDVTSPFTLPPVSMPIHTSKYDWFPLQVGDPGVAVPVDVYLGGVSGLGGGTAGLTQQANLSTHRFVPISNSSWTPPGGNGNVRISQGPAGVRLQDTGGNTILFVDNQGHVVITGELRVSGEITAGYGGSDSVTLQKHTHTQPDDSAGDSEQPTNAPTAGT